MRTNNNIIADTAQQYINDNGLDNELYDIVCEMIKIKIITVKQAKDLLINILYVLLKIYSMIETLILLGCLYLSIRVTDYVEKQKQ